MNASTLPLRHPQTNLFVPLAALLAGAALSAGVIAVADTNEVASAPAKVILLDSDLRGSKASAIGRTTPQADERHLGGPRGLASSLGNR